MELAALIGARATHAGLEASPSLTSALGEYLTLLAQWNRRINLTALSVDPPDEEAIDRLIVEPLRAAQLLAASDRVVLDIGSGGGSPAIPMKLAAPARRFVLVEVKDRKSAFLREVIRHLALADTDVRTTRAEALPRPVSLEAAADVVTLRAVRLDAAMVAAIRGQLRPSGRLLWFRRLGSDVDSVPRGLTIVAEHKVWPDAPSRVTEATVDGG